MERLADRYAERHQQRPTSSDPSPPLAHRRTREVEAAHDVLRNAGILKG